MPRELIEPRKGDKRYVRRKTGKFTTSQDDVGRSLAADRRKKSKTVAKKGEGDRGDRKPRASAAKAKVARKSKKVAKKTNKKTKKASLLSRLFGR